MNKLTSNFKIKPVMKGTLKVFTSAFCGLPLADVEKGVICGGAITLGWLFAKGRQLKMFSVFFSRVTTQFAMVLSAELTRKKKRDEREKN